ncbi:hypothetical protein E5Q42_25485 [Escherichia coli]|nr:hypothetical protein [Escherichia coli]
MEHLCCSEVSISPLFRWPNSVCHFRSIPCFLPTPGHPHAVALPSARCGQLAGGLSPPRLCWITLSKR